MVNVPSNVKKNYSSCEHLMISASKAYICSAFMKWAGIQSTSDSPSFLEHLPNGPSVEEKWNFPEDHIGKFVDEFAMTEFDIEKKWREEKEKKRQEKENQRMQEGTTAEPSVATAAEKLREELLAPGHLTIMLKKQSGNHQFLAVGKILGNPDNILATSSTAAVQVISILAPASNIFTPGQVVIWPKELLAALSTSQTTMDQTDQEKKELDSKNTVSETLTDVKEEDRLLNYGLQIIQLGLMLMQLNDTESEGDGERSLINWKMLMLYFRCRKRGTKYAYEALRLITCIRALYTEKTAHRVLHGQFVNPRGGLGHNYANDLKMEHLVRSNKDILKGLCANKTLKAVQRCSKAAHGLKEICQQFDNECNISDNSTAHTHACSTEDIKEMLKIINTTKPFHHQPGRNLHTFPNISKTPLDKLNVQLLHSWMTDHKRKLFKNMYLYCGDEDNEDEDSSNESEDDDLSTDEDDGP